MRGRICLLFLGIMFIPVLHAGQPATVLLDTQLYKEPFLDAESISSVSADSSVDILRRKGGWYQILVTPEQIGWVRMTTLRLKPATPRQEGGSSSAGDALDAVITGRLGASDVNTTTGVKGLDEEDLQNARPDTEALETMKSYRVGEKNAAGYASDLKLKSHRVNYLVEMENVLPETAAGSREGE